MVCVCARVSMHGSSDGLKSIVLSHSGYGGAEPYLENSLQMYHTNDPNFGMRFNVLLADQKRRCGSGWLLEEPFLLVSLRFCIVVAVCCLWLAVFSSEGFAALMWFNPDSAVVLMHGAVFVEQNGSVWCIRAQCRVTELRVAVVISPVLC